MRKLFVGAAVLAGLVALRRFGPALAERCMRKCAEMFERMPEGGPKRMMSGSATKREPEPGQEPADAL